jgi:hypothetical protein
MQGREDAGKDAGLFTFSVEPIHCSLGSGRVFVCNCSRRIINTIAMGSMTTGSALPSPLGEDIDPKHQTGMVTQIAL